MQEYKIGDTVEIIGPDESRHRCYHALLVPSKGTIARPHPRLKGYYEIDGRARYGGEMNQTLHATDFRLIAAAPEPSGSCPTNSEGWEGGSVFNMTEGAI